MWPAGGDGGGNPAPVNHREEAKRWAVELGRRLLLAVSPSHLGRTTESPIKKAEFARIFSIHRHPSISVEQRRLPHSSGGT
jgi:hypothetical protein